MIKISYSKIVLHRHRSMRIERSGSFTKVRERSRASWPSDRDRPTIRLLLFRRPFDEDPTMPMSRDANRSMKITIAIHMVLPDHRNRKKSRLSDEPYPMNL